MTASTHAIALVVSHSPTGRHMSVSMRGARGGDDVEAMRSCRQLAPAVGWQRPVCMMSMHASDPHELLCVCACFIFRTTVLPVVIVIIYHKSVVAKLSSRMETLEIGEPAIRDMHMTQDLDVMYACFGGRVAGAWPYVYRIMWNSLIILFLLLRGEAPGEAASAVQAVRRGRW